MGKQPEAANIEFGLELARDGEWIVIRRGQA